MDRRFSEELEEKLRYAGWFPGRCVDEARLLEQCAGYCRFSGCRLFSAAFYTLREFADLHIPIDFPVEDDGQPSLLLIGIDPQTPFLSSEPLVFNTDKEAQWTKERAQREWFNLEWMLNDTLFSIGISYTGDMHYYIGVSGRVYMTGYGYFFAGNSFDEFLENTAGITKSEIKRLNTPEMLQIKDKSNQVFDAVLKEHRKD